MRLSDILLEPGARVVKELCEKVGGDLRFLKQEEILVCRVNISSPQQAYNLFEEVSDFIARKYGFEKTGLGTEFSFWKDTSNGNIRGAIDVSERDRRNLKALEISYDGDFIEITPISKRGRGCTLYLNKNTLGVYCEKNGCYASAEGSLWH